MLQLVLFAVCVMAVVGVGPNYTLSSYATFQQPAAVAIDNDGSYLITNMESSTIWRYTHDGGVTLFAGGASAKSDPSTDVPVLEAIFQHPQCPPTPGQFSLPTHGADACGRYVK